MERVAGGYSIVEGPCWDSTTGVLYFADGFTGGVLALRPGRDTPELVIPKRRCSGLALHEAGGLVASGRNVGWKHGDESARLLELDPAWGMAFFNDLTTGLDGRIYVGSLDLDLENTDRVSRPGYLHMIDLDGSSRIVADDIGTANGVAVSPDGRELYLNDTYRMLVRRYEVLSDGGVNERTPLMDYSGGAKGDLPDGMAVASDGSVWVALAETGCVAIIGPGGEERGRIPVPGHHVTSLCFGGDDLRTLFITTMHQTETGQPDGSVFKIRVDIAGTPVAPARVSLPH